MGAQSFVIMEEVEWGEFESILLLKLNFKTDELALINLIRKIARKKRNRFSEQEQLQLQTNRESAAHYPMVENKGTKTRNKLYDII